MSVQYLCQFFDFTMRPELTGWVMWVRYEYNLGLRADAPLKMVKVKVPGAGLVSVHGRSFNLCPSKLNLVHVLGVVWLKHMHVVARPYQVHDSAVE